MKRYFCVIAICAFLGTIVILEFLLGAPKPYAVPCVELADTIRSVTYSAIEIERADIESVEIDGRCTIVVNVQVAK